MDGCSIFREELSIRYPNQGCALWEPDPQCLYEAVAVGDVGFIDKGYFHRLFNALCPPPDSDSPDGPKYPPRLRPKNPRLRKSIDSHQAFFSEKVTKLSGQSNLYASGPDDVTFSCPGTRGALSYLPIPADREETSAHGDFRKWILKYIDDCFKVAEAFGCAVDHMGDIILVTGRHLARSWVNVAFSGSSGSGGQVSFKVQVTTDPDGDLHVAFEERDVSRAELKLGPSGKNPPQNQCIFIQGYRVVRILNFWPRIRAAGPDSELPEPGPESGSDMHLKVVGIPSEADYRDPIHVLFEYIAEQAFNCDMILVHDNDLGFMSSALPSDTLSEYIRNHAPAIQQVRYELLPRDESSSGTEASTVTVATLSHDLLEAPSPTQNNLECPQLTDTTDGSDNEISQPVFQEDVAPQSRSISVSLTDDDLSNDGAIPPPTVSSHNVLPDPDPLQCSSVSSPQSDSRMDTPVLSPIEPMNQPLSMPQIVLSPTPTQSISNFSLLPIHESCTSEEPEDMEQDSSDEDSRPVNDVSTSLSNLDIATEQRRHAPTTTFLSLPWLAKWHFYTYLPSRDCIALSRTCRQMYIFNTSAYTHLQFLPPNSLFSLSRSMYRLSEVLARSRHYAEAVRTVSIVGWNTLDIPESCTYEEVYRTLDDGIAALLEKSPHVFSFTLDLDQSKAINDFPKTFTTLTLVRTIRDLRLATFLVPSYTAENNPLLASVPDETPPAYQRVCLSVCSGEWLPILMHDPRNLRWFAFHVLDTDKAPQPGDGDENGCTDWDTNWVMTLRRVAEAATELETLVLHSGRHFDAKALGQMLRFGFDLEVLRKLRSFSVNATTLSLSSLTQLFCGFARASVTHLKIVVNHYGTWLPDFGPQYIFELAKLVPNLEEITLDQLAMPDVAPLPGEMDIWGEAFRMFKKLRRIAFASMFVLDLCRPRPVDEDEGDYEEDEEETGGDEDAVMGVDDSDDDKGDEGYKTEVEKNDGTPRDALAPKLVHLAAWADRFLGDHLRTREPFTEIWFLDPRFPGQTAAGFTQRVMEGDGEGAKAEHMIYYPILKRNGWWWDEYEPIPLD